MGFSRGKQMLASGLADMCTYRPISALDSPTVRTPMPNVYIEISKFRNYRADASQIRTQTPLFGVNFYGYKMQPSMTPG